MLIDWPTYKHTKVTWQEYQKNSINALFKFHCTDVYFSFFRYT